mmetsp:Transcript_13040/g.54626  ORF Transcript_13040/g.54626 Transcript_13040/m.54626 type:complete len:333 (-) Transcript_13040:2253-3251(-)
MTAKESYTSSPRVAISASSTRSPARSSAVQMTIRSPSRSRVLTCTVAAWPPPAIDFMLRLVFSEDTLSSQPRSPVSCSLLNSLKASLPLSTITSASSVTERHPSDTMYRRLGSLPESASSAAFTPASVGAMDTSFVWCSASQQRSPKVSPDSRPPRAIHLKGDRARSSCAAVMGGAQFHRRPEDTSATFSSLVPRSECVNVSSPALWYRSRRITDMASSARTTKVSSPDAVTSTSDRSVGYAAAALTPGFASAPALESALVPPTRVAAEADLSRFEVPGLRTPAAPGEALGVQPPLGARVRLQASRAALAARASACSPTVSPSRMRASVRLP